MKKKIVLLAIGVGLVFSTSNVFAGGWAGGGGDSSFGQGGTGEDCANSGGRIDCGISWLKYEYIKGSNLEGQVYKFNPNGDGTGDGKEIAGDCAKDGVGFYHLGIIIKPNREFKNYGTCNTCLGNYSYIGNQTYGGIQNYWNGVATSHLFDGTYSVDPGSKIYGEPYVYTYRLNGANSLGHRFSLSIKTAGGYYTGDNQNSTYNTDGAYSHILYKNAKPMYKSVGTAASKDSIKKSYAAFLNHKYADGKNAPENQTYSKQKGGGCTYSNGSWNCKNMPDDIYAFCAFPESNPTGLSPKAKLTIEGHPKSPIATSYNFSSSNTDTATNSTIYVVNNKTITVKSNFNFKLDKAIKTKSFKPTLSIGGQSIAANNLSFTGSVGEIGDGLDDANKTKTITLTANEATKICATAKTPGSQIDINGISGSERTAEACLYVKYVPITATIDSDTRATLDGINYDSGADTSKTFPNANNYITVEAGPNTVTWSHYLGWTSRSDNIKTGNVWTKTYGLNGTKALGNALSVGKYNKNSHTIYLKKDDDGYPGMKGDNNTSEAGVFPGEAREVSQSLKHPSIVQVNSGDAATGSSDESSSVKLRLKAEDIQCGISKDSYGLDEDIVYSIGVDNPNDYRWLSIKNDNNIKKTVGDDTLQNDVFWLKPESQIQITQTACFGSQIKIDADNAVEDRFNTNPWKNQDYTNDSANSVFGLESWIPADRGLFDDTEAPNDVGSHHESSLAASEIGISDFSKVSTPSSRVANGYKIETISNAAVIENLGKSLYTSFSKPNRESVSITTKIPYNYYMSLNLAPDDSKGYLTSENTTFTVNIKNEGRINTQVCNDTSQCGAYATKSKKTTAGMLVFAISSEFKAMDLDGKDSFSYNGNIFDSANDSLLEERMVEAVKNHFPYGDSINVIDRNHLRDIKNKEFDTDTTLATDSITSDNLNLNDLAVGTKVCAVAAVYPSDSHDTGNGNSIDDSVQSAAFRPTGAKTGLKVSCRTVAKHQNMSVEGNGVVTTQRINSSTTTHNTTNDKKIFRSWSEYQIISGGSGSNASSGAVTAYALNNMAGKTENMSADPDFSSVSSGSYLYPQTLGNYSLDIIGGKKSDPNSEDESQVNWRYSETLIKNIVDTYGKGGGDCVSGDLPTSNNYLECINGGSLPYVYKEGKDTLVVKSTGTLTINNDSHLDDLSYWGSPKQLIIIAKDILIDKSVRRVNAWLIVDGGKLNTCNDYKINAPEDKSNQNLLDFCNTQLFINGPVIVNGDLILPRTFGGGSVLENGEFVKDPNTLVQRAEIFNYDPSVVEWAYRESQKNPHLETTYTETLAPRL